MANVMTDQIRNIALAGHGGTGKTSLADAVVFTAGAVNRLGSPRDHTSVFDFEQDEQERGVSINATIGHCDWKNHHIGLIDTPGYADFFGEVCGAVHVADAVVIVVSAAAGVEVQTEKAWELARKLGKPVMFFVNKMDAERADFDKVVAQIREQLEANAVPLQLPLGTGAGFQGLIDIVAGQAHTYADGKLTVGPVPDDMADAVQTAAESLTEAAAEGDDELIEKFLEEGELTPDETLRGLRAAVAARAVCPVACGSAEKLVGVAGFLDLVTGFLPAPGGEVVGTKPGTEEEVVRPVSAEAPAAALVFKTLTDPYVGKLSFFKVMSGTLKDDAQLLNASTGERERIGHLFANVGKEQRPAGNAVTGMLVCAAKLDSVRTGHTLCAEDTPVLLPAPEFPEPMMSLAVDCREKGEEDKLSVALTRLAEEDATFHWTRSADTGDTLISGLADLHLDVCVQRMQRKFGVHVDVRPPRIAYRESIRKTAERQGKFKRQTGGRGQFGDVHLRVEPMPRGGGFEFVDAIVGGVIPGKFLPAVEKGIREAMTQGIVAGYPMQDVRATAFDGSSHSVDSSDMAFKIAGSMGFKEAALAADPYLLEPIVTLTVLCPEENMGDVIGDVNSRRGRILGMEKAGKSHLVRAEVPLAEIVHYAADLRSMSGGRASYSTEFSRYEEVPAHLTEQIRAGWQKHKEEEN